MVYLHLFLAHSKGQTQGHANFDYEYLINGDRWDKYCYCQYIESCLCAFDWCIYYMHLTLSHFKYHSQGHANFDCEYPINGYR